MIDLKFVNIDNVKFEDVKLNDIEDYYQIKKATCEKFVDMYFGGWNEEEQRKYNNRIFEESLLQTCFKIIKIENKTVGFFGFSIFEKEIGCVTLQIVDIKERKIIFEGLLKYLSNLAEELNLPIYAKSFLDSQDIEFYKNAGFEIMSTTNSHYNLKRI